MDYEFKYRLAQAPQATQDGSQCVLHDIWAIYRARDAAPADPWMPVPGRHKTIAIPGSELLIVLQGPDIVGKYKQALVNNLNTIPVPLMGWDKISLEKMMDNSDLSFQAAADANEYITVTLGLSYPVDFNI